MSAIRKILSLLLLLAILPATAHCSLESAGVFQTEHCCAGGDSSDECADLCDTLESKGFRIQKDQPLVIAVAALIPVIEPELSSAKPGAIERADGRVLEQRSRWRFMQRLVAPARAP